jgi:hypothetical protein
MGVNDSSKPEQEFPEGNDLTLPDKLTRNAGIIQRYLDGAWHHISDTLLDAAEEIRERRNQGKGAGFRLTVNEAQMLFIASATAENQDAEQKDLNARLLSYIHDNKTSK